MTREQYVKMTDTVRDITDQAPLGARILHVPTYICAAIYIVTLIILAVTRDLRIVRALLVPAVCFAAVTALRPLINRQRPYDFFDHPPVGRCKRGKGKSMPSRHTVSAAAIAFAVIYAFPTFPVVLVMLPLSTLIAALRILSGQHYPEDVAVGFALAVALSLLGYFL